MKEKPDRILHRRRFKINWPLLLGILLIGGVVYLAINGPSLAPRDPLEENLIIRDEADGEWHIPPFEAFAVTGFPLGSDEFGRDMLSRLLFAVRPTLQMVLVVAAVRLLLGTLVGLVAGWSVGRLGGFFDSLISSALALPGLLVALGAIAIVGVELGVLAFIIGLSITGWAETARLVREQTRAIRSEVYVEAAHALGATDPQIVFRHVVRQIRATLLMLFAFEIGSTLMLTAGLGFLGYYIGGDVWVDVADFVARRTSGSPELGQMLATAWVRLTDPWGLVAVGSVVFASVLGFNLIGEGLRLRIDPENEMGRIRWLSDGLSRLRLNLEQAWYPVGRLLFGSRVAVSLWMVAAGFGLGYAAVYAWQQGIIRLPEPQINLFFDEAEPEIIPTPTTSTTGAQDAEVILAAGNGWNFSMPDILLVDPFVSVDGHIYLLTLANTV
jgi:ABC-type dipeptide/oligopeptide/nickel transport system permease subunit